ncbi:MAG: DUF5916 domain-containing protein [Rhodothermales bacterium]
MRLCRLLCLVVLASFFLSDTLAQDRPPLVLHRMTGPIVLDGFSDEPDWEAIEPLPVVQYEPRYGVPPSEDTEIRFGYDDHYLYASLRAYDKDRNGIRANTLYRDRLSGDDHFEILLDTYNDNETGILITTTPAGNRLDASISNDASGGGISNSSWLNRSFNTFWDVKTQVTPEGWFAELRIPFSSLRFEPHDGKVIMGMTVQRKVARRSERLIYPDIPPTVNWAFLKPSRAQKIVMEDITPSNPVYITPYALGGGGMTQNLNPEINAFNSHTDWKHEVGVDLKYGLTSNLNLDLTVNTDFAQAEADDQQVNLTRFNLFFPEKRQFFQERSGLFDFKTGGQSRLFHSRRIGLTEAGQPVRILGGARVVGRVGGWEFGFLDMHTAEFNALPSENFGVLRARRQVINSQSYAGVMSTTRIGVDGSYNLAYGIDGLIRIVGDDFLNFQWAQTFDKRDLAGADVMSGGRLTAEIERRRRAGFGYRSGWVWSGENYNPGIGFIQRNDFLLSDQSVSYTWLPGESSKLIWHTLALGGNSYLRNADGTAESAEGTISWSYSDKRLSSGTLEARIVYEDLLEPFVLSSDAQVPIGSYTNAAASFEYTMPQTQLKKVSFAVDAGSFFDGWRSSIALTPTWYVSKYLELTGQYEYSRIRFPDRDQEFDAHIARLRIGTALNTMLSANAFIQYNSAVDRISTNLRLRYNFREGNDLWIVYDEQLNSDRNRFAEYVLPTSNGRTLIVKYTYTFAI